MLATNLLALILARVGRGSLISQGCKYRAGENQQAFLLNSTKTIPKGGTVTLAKERMRHMLGKGDGRRTTLMVEMTLIFIVTLYFKYYCESLVIHFGHNKKHLKNKERNHQN